MFFERMSYIWLYYTIIVEKKEDATFLVLHAKLLVFHKNEPICVLPFWQTNRAIASRAFLAGTTTPSHHHSPFLHYMSHEISP